MRLNDQEFCYGNLSKNKKFHNIETEELVAVKRVSSQPCYIDLRM